MNIPKGFPVMRLAALVAVVLLGAVSLGIGATGEWSETAVTRVLVGCIIAVLLLADVRPPPSGDAPALVNSAVKAAVVWFASDGAASMFSEVLS